MEVIVFILRIWGMIFIGQIHHSCWISGEALDRNSKNIALVFENNVVRYLWGQQFKSSSHLPRFKWSTQYTLIYIFSKCDKFPWYIMQELMDNVAIMSGVCVMRL